MYKHFFKRIIDIFLSVCGIIVMAIPMLICAVIIKHEDPGPAFFIQKRVGQKKNGKITYFNLFKLRSMKMSAPHDTPTHLLENPDQYMLNCGKKMRKFSLDEVPQLINILLADMSFVGPRPALWNLDNLIAEREKRGANDCKPGLTGWAQINGRDELEISEKAKFDGEYANNLTFMMDMKCFFRTFLKVFKADGVVEGGTGEVKVTRIQQQESLIMQKAESFLGMTDQPTGSNNIIFNTDYYGSEVSGWEYLWCVVFIWDIFRMCGLSELFYNGEKTNQCIKVHQWGEEQGLLIPKDEGRYGDIVIFSWNGDSFDHIGFICKKNEDGSYTTIEGNTPPAPDSPVRGVFQKKRAVDYIYSIVRPRYNSHLPIR